MLCMQLSRVYLVIPADAFICNIPDHSHGATSAGAQHLEQEGDHESEALEATSFESQGDGHTYIQHCKDTLDGLGLAPAQPFGLPVATSPKTPETAVKVLPSEIPSVLDNFLPPPFQPPRNIS